MWGLYYHHLVILDLNYDDRCHTSTPATTDTQRLEQRMDKLTFLVRQLTLSQHEAVAPVRTYGICSLSTHSINECLTVHEEEVLPQAYAIGIFPG